jgi:hypothetical protein
MRAYQMKALLLEKLTNAGKQMIITASVSADDPRQRPEGQQIRPKSPQRGPDQRADKHNVTTASRPRKPCKRAELPDPKPMMRITFNLVRLRMTANPEQHDRATTLCD